MKLSFHTASRVEFNLERATTYLALFNIEANKVKSGVEILNQNLKLMNSNHGFTKVLAMNMLGKVIQDQKLIEESKLLA